MGPQTPTQGRWADRLLEETERPAWFLYGCSFDLRKLIVNSLDVTEEPFKAHISERLGDSLRLLSKVLSVFSIFFSFFFFIKAREIKAELRSFHQAYLSHVLKKTSELLASLGYDPFFMAPTSFNMNGEIQDAW